MKQLSFFDIVTEEEKIEESTEIREMRGTRLFINGTFVPKFQLDDVVEVTNKFVKGPHRKGKVVKTYGPFCYIENGLAWDQDELKLIERKEKKVVD